jgi:four helix bundle protein
MFGFRRLDVYRCSISFLGPAAAVAERIPRGYAPLADQLRRAAISVPLNIAEGNGKFEQDACRFYTIARGSALECAAIMDVLETLGFAPANEIAPLRDMLERVVSMLSGMLRRRTTGR